MGGEARRGRTAQAAAERHPIMAARLLINDLGRHNRPLLAEIEQALRTVLHSGWHILGSQVAAFETSFAAFCGCAHAIGVGNGTDALELALRAVGVGPGDQVITVANAGGYSTTAILCAGAEPLYVDVMRDSMSMDLRHLKTRITTRTKAIVATHLYGRMVDMPEMLGIAGGIAVIEDCAQAHGARLRGRVAGSWGRLGCFSFYPTKNLGALGDAGATTTNDAGLAERVRMLRQYGWKRKYDSVIAGGRNSRLDEMQAAVFSGRSGILEKGNKRR